MIAVVVVLGALGFAGCMAGDEDTTGTGGPLIGPGAEPVPKRFFANDCQGAFFGVNWPGGHPRAEQPPGWEEEDAIYTTLQTAIMECDRLSWGPFERGPIRFLYEGHTEAEAPSACTEVDRTTGFAILHSFWVSDEEVADFLSETYPGMNVHYANFTYEERSGDAGLTEIHWSWQEEGLERSGVTILHDGTYDQDIQFHNRYFWWNGSSVSYMNITEDFQHPGVTRPLLADVNPPMLMADWPLQDPAPSTGMPWRDITLTGEIRVFEDLECEQEA